MENNDQSIVSEDGQEENEFTTEWETEKHAFVWKIKNFTAIHEKKRLKNERIILKFVAGNLELEFATTNKTVLFFRPKERYYEGEKNLFAQFCATINRPNPDKKMIVSQGDTGMKEYSNNSDNSATPPAWGLANFATLEELKTAEALTNDTLAIHVKITIYGKEVVRNTSIYPEILQRTAMDELTKHFGVLLESGEGSDFVIRVKKLNSQGCFEKKVHRTVLSARSLVFKTMMESEMSEKATGVVTIEDLTPTGLDILLEFIYTGNLHENWILVPEEIVNAAEKYDLPLMLKFCNKGLHTACTTENAFTLLNLANTHGLSEASKNISQFIKANFENVLSKV